MTGIIKTDKIQSSAGNDAVTVASNGSITTGDIGVQNNNAKVSLVRPSNSRTGYVSILDERGAMRYHSGINGGGEASNVAHKFTGDSASSNTVYMSILGTGGITFNGDTAAANALDDYEEGTWTPAFSVGNSDLSSRGWYIKVGGLVTVGFGNLTGINVIGDSAKYTISGFPFAVKLDSATGNYKYSAAASLVLTDASDASYSNKLHAARIQPTGTVAILGVHNITNEATTTGDPFSLHAVYQAA